MIAKDCLSSNERICIPCILTTGHENTPGHLKAEISHTYVVNRGICPRHSDANIGYRQTHDLYSSAKTLYSIICYYIIVLPTLYIGLVGKHDENTATTKTEA